MTMRMDYAYWILFFLSIHFNKSSILFGIWSVEDGWRKGSQGAAIHNSINHGVLLGITQSGTFFFP